MGVETRSRPASVERRARAAVAVLFLTNGALFANLIPRYPQIKADIGMDNAVYGLAVAAFPMGAIVAGPASAALIRRFGSARVATAGTFLTGLGLFAAGMAPSAVAFAATLLVAGAADAGTDVAQNAHGLRVQRRYGRSILNSFHALWSVGGVLGGSMAAGAIALSVPVDVHLGVAAAAFALVALLASRFCLPGHDGDTEATPSDAGGVRAPVRASRSRTVFVLIALAMLAVVGTTVEDAGNTWAALYLSESLRVPAALATTGYIALIGAQVIGRVFGDRFVDRFGQRTVARAGGLIVATGMGMALALPTIPGTVAGFAAAGLGVATLVPAAMHEADELPGLRPGTGLTIVSWIMRLGFLLSPPLVGLVADAAGVRIGLFIIPIAGALAVALAGALHPRPEPHGRVPRPEEGATAADTTSDRR